jgi:hypothetical protein
VLARHLLYHVSHPPTLNFLDLFESGSPYVAQAGLELQIFMCKPPECLDYRPAPSSIFF